MLNISTIFIVLWTILLKIHLAEGGGGGGSAYVPLEERLEHAPAPEVQSIYVPVIDYIKEHYVTMAMPVCRENDIMETKIDVWLYQLFGLHEPTQALTVDVWIDMTWNDCQLKWDPQYFNNITQITMPAGEIWYPDILFYQSLHGNFEEGLFIFRESVARIRYDGTVQLGAQVLLRSFCRVRIDYFPFDTQYCNITFASWNKDTRVFRLVKRDSDGHDTLKDDSMEENTDKRGHSFKEASNGEWEVIGFPSFNSISAFAVGADEGVKLNYSEVTFQLQLKRKPNYILVYLVFPCVLLIWVSTVTFLLPLESGEKVNLSVTILLSLIVFLLLVADNIPRTADSIPTLGVFYTLSIILVSLSVLMQTIVLNFGLKTQEIKLPWRIKKIMTYPIWRLVLFHYLEHSENHEWISLGMMKQHQKDCETKGNEQDECPEIAMLTEDYTVPPCRKNDWRFFAMLLDRLFFLAYLLLAIGLTIYIYTYQPTDSRRLL